MAVRVPDVGVLNESDSITKECLRRKLWGILGAFRKNKLGSFLMYAHQGSF
jgi:hypothetical protein